MEIWDMCVRTLGKPIIESFAVYQKTANGRAEMTVVSMGHEPKCSIVEHHVACGVWLYRTR